MLCEDKRETLKSQSPVSEQNLEQEPAEEVEDKRQKVDEGKELSEQHRASLHTCCGDIVSFDCVRNGTPCTYGCPCTSVGGLLVGPGISAGK